MTYEPHHKSDKPNHTAATVAGWIEKMRNEKWSINKLCKHLGMGYGTVQAYLEKYEAGLLK